jgi:DNA-binding NarL/FixJ family response regulator
MKTTALTVVVVDDDDEIRTGIVSLIAGAPDITCIGDYVGGEEALAALRTSVPDVVLMDIQMPEMSGIECTRRLKEKDPSLQIMMLTMYEDEESIFASLKAGATGYLVKTTPREQVLEAIRDLVRGGSPMSSSIARKVVNAFHQSPAGSAETDHLTPREEEILAALAKGYRYKEVAEKLFISPETVRSHVHRIYEKLHVRSRTEAVVKYLKR